MLRLLGWKEEGGSTQSEGREVAALLLSLLSLLLNRRPLRDQSGPPIPAVPPMLDGRSRFPLSSGWNLRNHTTRIYLTREPDGSVFLNYPSSSSFSLDTPLINLIRF